jgi:hypothetical protein
MVPSMTETLLEAGVQVVGRTRFCVHPQAVVKSIPAVGGTKDWQLSQVRDLQPDLIIFDKEENPKFMATEAPCPWVATHIQQIGNVADNLLRLNSLLHNAVLQDFATRWQAVASANYSLLKDWTHLPGVLKWLRQPQEDVTQILYLIWNKPMMAVSRETFIGSIFKKVSGGHQLAAFSKPYPKINLSEYEPEKTLLLLSSEPFPFHRFQSEFENLEFPAAIVNGEAFSWFGLRSLIFLEQVLAKNSTHL